MNTIHHVYFKATGSGEFPYDMLRYDCCYPQTETSAHKLTYSHEWREVYLVSPAREDGWTPRVERWSSQGWSVVDVTYFKPLSTDEPAGSISSTENDEDPSATEHDPPEEDADGYRAGDISPDAKGTETVTPKSSVPLSLGLRDSLYRRGYTAVEMETIAAIADALDHLVEGCRKYPDEMSLEALAGHIEEQAKVLRKLSDNPLHEAHSVPDYKAVLLKYKNHEKDNDHSEAALLLAETFGTESEVGRARQLLAERDRRGSGSPERSQFQYQMSQKYYRTLVSKATENP